MAAEDVVAGEAALAAGRWEEARAAFETALTQGEEPAAFIGLASALWWLGDSHGSVRNGMRAYARFRQAGDTDRAVECAVWLAITYKANFGNAAAANGWSRRADRLLTGVDVGPLHGWSWLATAYRMPDLDRAECLTEQALEVARQASDADLELAALSQLGLIRVGKGDADAGFALIDESVAAVLAGERARLDTVVYACCDMLNACELAGDVERAAQWCRVADDFADTYGCPYLYAECRIYYGSVLTATGRWPDAERELDAGRRITDGACPGLHNRALARLAALHIRQGRLEEAQQVLDDADRGAGDESELLLWRAALALARGDAAEASATLEQRLLHVDRHRSHLAVALDLLVDAHVLAGDRGAAATAATRLAEIATATTSAPIGALAAAASGRVSISAGDWAAGIDQLETALRSWSDVGFPYELARTRFELGRAHAGLDDSAAVGHARQALDAFRELGATVDADRAAAFLRSLGVNTGRGRGSTGRLTSREEEVLGLLGRGLTNPEIAARLHVSRKTASHHVSSILTKLNLRNRSEAAAHYATLVRTDEPVGSPTRASPDPE